MLSGANSVRSCIAAAPPQARTIAGLRHHHQALLSDDTNNARSISNLGGAGVYYPQGLTHIRVDANFQVLNRRRHPAVYLSVRQRGAFVPTSNGSLLSSASLDLFGPAKKRGQIPPLPAADQLPVDGGAGLSALPRW